MALNECNKASSTKYMHHHNSVVYSQVMGNAFDLNFVVSPNLSGDTSSHLLVHGVPQFIQINVRAIGQ